MNITLGNKDQNLHFNGTPTKTSDVFTAQGNMKFTAQSIPVGTRWTLQVDTPFNKFLGFSQTQNAKVTFGLTDSSGILGQNPPHSAVVHDQQQIMLYKEPKQGFCDLASSGYLTIEFTSESPVTFTANVG